MQLLRGFSNLYASCLSEKNACHMNPTLNGSITLKYLINLEAIIIAYLKAIDCSGKAAVGMVDLSHGFK